MLKFYHSWPALAQNGACASIAASSWLGVESIDDTDGLRMNDHICSRPRLAHSEMLKSLQSLLGRLSPEHQKDITDLINEYTYLFGDAPTRTTVLEHDINVQNAKADQAAILSC